MATAVYFIGQSAEAERPMALNLRNPQDCLNEPFMMNYRIARLKPNCKISDWTPWNDLICTMPGTSPVAEWDYYYFYGTTGLISARALEVLGPYVQTCFVPLPSTIETGETYYSLVPINFIDCLDAANCKPRNPKDIDHISKHKFHLDRLTNPMIFTISLRPCFLYGTESIGRIIKKAGLKGFELKVLDGVPSKSK